MATLDITRFLRQPHKHYSAVRLQQGRLLLDADHDEGSYLSREDQRRAAEDLFGPKGSPDDGFSMGAPLPLVPPMPAQTALLRPGDTLNEEALNLNGTLTPVLPVSLRAGTFYLGGLRFVLEAPEHFALQRDFLQLKPEDVPQPDPADTDHFRVLYYLHAWEQCVTPVEDEEILELALAGADTSGRLRRMRRVEQLSPLAANERSCDAAFSRLVSNLEAENARFDANTCELLSLGRLQLTFDDSDDQPNCGACVPDPATTFLGADNQTLRIMLTAAGTFVWALDNAAPLVRVKVTGLDDLTPGAEVTVELLDDPSDESQWPLANRVLELLPFSAVLDGKMPEGHEHPHFKKVAERIGAFSRVAKPFDPDTRTFTIDTALGIEEMRDFVHAWDTRHPSAAELNFPPDEDERYLYLRLWHTAPTLAEVHLPTGDSPLLGSTGVRPRFVHPGRRGDFWVAALRPETPERMQPLDLAMRSDGVPPHGPRDFYAPLAVLEVDDDTVGLTADCRARIQPLTDNGCVTATVGDGVESQGDFVSIQEAVESLPSDGGRVLVQRGTYRERVVISGRVDVTLEGCGDATVIETPGAGDLAPTAALVTVTDCQRIRIGSLRLQTIHERAVAVRESEDVSLDGLSAVAGLRVGSEFRPGASVVSAPLFEVRQSTEVRLRQLLGEPHARGGVEILDSDHVSAEDLVFAGAPVTAASPELPLIRVRDSELVRVHGGVLSSFGQVGVRVEGPDARVVEIEELAAICGGHRAGTTTSSQSAIDIDGAERVTVRGCAITMDESFSEHAAIVVKGEAIRIVGNRLDVLPECFDSPPRPLDQCVELGVQAWGGIHLRGGSVGVEIEDNRIAGGVGHGITLGSVIYVDGTGTVTARRGAGNGQMAARSDGQLGANGRVRPNFRDSANRLLVADNEGALTRIFIRNNRIEQMSGNGISVLSLLGMPEGDFVDVDGLVIDRNMLTGNMSFPGDAVPLDDDVLPFVVSLGDGGIPIPRLPCAAIALGTVTGADLRDNVIVGNGTSPVLPTSGIFILNGDAIRITGNRITGNGARASTAASSPPRSGVRAGIAVLLAGTGDASSRSALDTLLADRGANLADDGSSLRITHNSVRHPEGRALFAIATGPVAIEDNFLSSEGNHGADTSFDRLSVGDAVYVQNIGVPWETEVDSPLDSDIYDSFTTPNLTSPYLDFVTPMSPWQFAGEGGCIQFNNNQVTYDWEVLRAPPSGTPLAYFAVALLTLDQLSVESNQFAFRLRGRTIRTSPPITTPPVVGIASEPVLSQVFGIGGTVQLGGNRCAEAVGNVTLSMMSISWLMSSASFNQTTHEIMTTNKSFAEPTPSPGDPPFNPSDDIDEDYLVRHENRVLFSDTDWTFGRVTNIRHFSNRFVSLLFESST